jgi:predicted dehydrogenase
MTEPLGIGIIGCGKIADYHIDTYKKDKRVDLKAVADMNEIVAKRTSKRYRIKDCYTDYRDLLEREDIDIVSVCVPNFLHYEVASNTILSGKNVLVEKPFTLKTEDAKKLINQALKRPVKLGVVQNKRYNSATQKAKAIVENGDLADIYLADFRLILPGPNIGRKGSSWTFDPTKSGGGALMDLGVHMVDLIRWMLGDVSNVYATTSSFFEALEVDCFASAILKMKSGALCSLEVGWLSSYQDDAITLWGTAGTLIIEPWFSYNEIIRGNRNPVSRTYAVNKSLAKTILMYILKTDETAESHYRLIRDFITSVVYDGSPPVTGEDGLEAIKIINAMYESAKAKKEVEIN